MISKVGSKNPKQTNNNEQYPFLRDSLTTWSRPALNSGLPQLPTCPLHAHASALGLSTPPSLCTDCCQEGLLYKGPLTLTNPSHACVPPSFLLIASLLHRPLSPTMSLSPHGLFFPLDSPLFVLAFGHSGP